MERSRVSDAEGRAGPGRAGPSVGSGGIECELIKPPTDVPPR
ncbi:hypothetical protein [Mycobacterium paragordonae]|nr:hypothetical protein [Mycobacterium paragordonae]